MLHDCVTFERILAEKNRQGNSTFDRVGRMGRKVNLGCGCEERSDEAIPKYGGRLLRPAKNAGLATTQNKEARL
jgi:hypothetical protein